jgi:protoheme IX farnesyltransferase
MSIIPGLRRARRGVSGLSANEGLEFDGGHGYLGVVDRKAGRRLHPQEWTGKTVTLRSWRRYPVGSSSFVTRLLDFIVLMKPRVMLLAVFTGVVGLASAPRHLDPFHALLAILSIAAGAGAAGVLNMWYDADIDAAMTRTAMRPIPRGRVSQIEAIALGLTLAIGAVLALGLVANLTAAALLAAAIVIYVVVYTAWLKRCTRYNIVIGGAAGALPPVIGWAAATGEVGLEPLVLFLIIFLWTPPHFWALALNRADDYASVNVPMLPVVSGSATTKRQILIYSALLLAASALPWALGFAGALYGATAAVLGTTLIVLALKLGGGAHTTARSAARRLFTFSITYLFALFAMLLVDHDSGLGTLLPTSYGSRSPTSIVRADLRAVAVQSARYYPGAGEI